MHVSLVSTIFQEQVTECLQDLYGINTNQQMDRLDFGIQPDKVEVTGKVKVFNTFLHD